MDFAQPITWVFTSLTLVIAYTGFRVVTSGNLIHSALALVFSLAGTAGLFLLLSAEFVAWVLVLVYMGAVMVLFLFGIMITKAPVGYDAELDNERKGLALVVAVSVFVLMSWSTILAFGGQEMSSLGVPTATEGLADALLGRFVLPFEIVSFVLLAALVGGITLARKDNSPAEEEMS